MTEGKQDKVADEIVSLVKKMTDNAARGIHMIPSSIVLSSLMRINEAHYREMDNLRKQIITALDGVISHNTPWK